MLPIPVSVGLIKTTSFSGFSSAFNAPLTNDQLNKTYAPISFLEDAFNSRALSSKVENHGNFYIYKSLDSSEQFYIEQLQPFNGFLYGSDFGFKRGFIDGVSGSGVKLSSNKLDVIEDQFLQFTKEEERSDDSNEVLEKYVFRKEDFLNSFVNGKGDLNLVIDLELKLNDHRNIQTASSIELKELIFAASQEFPVVSVTSEDENRNFMYYVKFEKQPSETEIHIKLIKRDLSITPSSHTNPPENPVSDVRVRNFYVIFSENPPLSFEGIFEEDKVNRTSNFYFGKTRVKRIFLDRWRNKSQSGLNKGFSVGRQPVPNSQSKALFDFSVTNSNFWKSTCSDPYKVGGFYKTKNVTPAVNGDKVTGNKEENKSFVQQQKALHESFDPYKARKNIDTGNDYQYQASRDYEEAGVCEGIDNATKALLNTYAKIPQDGNNPSPLNREKDTYIKWGLTPKAIKELLSNDQAQQQTPVKRKSKVIPASFRAWGDGYYPTGTTAQKAGVFNSSYEEANQSTHIFNVNIDKATLISELIEHQKLKENNLNQDENVSSQIQVNIPYSFTIYDPVINYLKQQKINLNLDLNLKSVYNQPKYVKEFFVYDLAEHHNKIGVDYGGYEVGSTKHKSEYGLSGTVVFSAGLFVDIQGNLKIQLITQVKGFVSTKNPTCDIRYRPDSNGNGSSSWECEGKGDGWKARKHIHIPPFIVLDINEDPKITSFYVDNRIGDSTSVSDPNDTSVKTLTSFKQEISKSNRTLEVVKVLDQTNNGEVYFESIDVTDPKAKRQQEALNINLGDKGVSSVATDIGWFSSSYFVSSYYVPRKNQGEIEIDDDDGLKKINLTISGSSSLGGSLFRSNYFGTKVTYCTSSTSNVSDSTHQCADGINYEKIEKDKNSDELKQIRTFTISADFEELKAANNASTAKKFNFLTAIHRPKNENNSNTFNFDQQKDKLKFIFEDGEAQSKFSSQTTKNDKSKFPEHSLVGVWYLVKLWYDQNKKAIVYETEIRCISAIPNLSGKDGTVSNDETTKVTGASANAGFQLSKVEFKYEA